MLPFGKKIEGSQDLFNQLDKDNDGKISYNEFLSFMKEGLLFWKKAMSGSLPSTSLPKLK